MLDSGLSNYASTVGSFLSAGTQVAIGWDKKDTALFIAKDELNAAYAKADWEGVGKGFMLGLS